LFGIKLSQFKYIQYIFVGIGIALTIIIVFGGMMSLKKVDKKKKKNK